MNMTRITFKSAKSAVKNTTVANFTLFNGDCLNLLRTLPDESIDLVVTSPPYFMGKEYDYSNNIRDFQTENSRIALELFRVLKTGGNLCWQVGYYVRNAEIIPLDYLAYEIFNSIDDLKLRNRIVWTFGHGTHSSKRFSGRHETILWFSKGDNYFFDLDSVRVPQKYPGKKHYHGPKKGQYSGNPLGKNPEDVWEIPHVKSKHIEKTDHPCQFPIALAQRLIKSLCQTGGIVLDPFNGAGSTGIASLLEGRRYIGAEKEERYCDITLERYNSYISGNLGYRPLEKPIYTPKNDSVAKRPAHFRDFGENSG